MHEAGYLKDHPDARPIGADGRVSPPPDDWQGVCPTHPGYRRSRMDAFRQTLRAAPIDGIWLDYHHAHASWEQARAQPAGYVFLRPLPVPVSKARPESSSLQARRPTAPGNCRTFTSRHGYNGDVVFSRTGSGSSANPRSRTTRRFAGQFHCPWSDTDYERCDRHKLGIDLKAQSQYLDVFSIMPYHARFGHADRSSLDLAPDPGWDDFSRSRVNPANGSRSGRSCSYRIGENRFRRLRSRDVLDHGTRSAGDRSHGVRLGDLAPAVGQGRERWASLPAIQPCATAKVY